MPRQSPTIRSLAFAWPALAVRNTSGEQDVWTAFHSEASARGFAGRLTATVGHPFTVARLGPAFDATQVGHVEEADDPNAG